MQIEELKEKIITVLLSYVERKDTGQEILHVIEQSDIGLIANDLIKELSLVNDN
ncbi:hypothetical protein [Flavobacterium filum]|uniref:hypothetical protein n=1 Tax=Flavobacterium filum TaxID=370974 RepID=UPI0023F4781C|nr:hypothetical protein [Flavobacterium filum]